MNPGHTTATPHFSPAVLILDETGVVQAANTSANTFWGAHSASLNGEAFTNLFQFEINSDDADWLEAQWLAVHDSSLDRDSVIDARTHDGTVRKVNLRIEKAVGLDSRLIATITPLPVAAKITAPPSNGFDLLSTQNDIGLFDLNPINGTAHYTPVWKKILGYVDAELANRYTTWTDLIHPEDSAAAPDQLSRHAATGSRHFNVEFRMRHQQGHYLWIHCLGLQIINEDAQVERVLGIILDITDRKEIEEASLANDERMQLLSGAGPLGAFEFDFISNDFWYSPAWGQLLGYGRDAELMGPQPFRASLLRDESRAGLEGWWLARHPGHTSWSEIVKLQRKDGSPITLLLGAERQLTRNHDLSRVTGFLCALPDNLSVLMASGSLAPALVDDTLASLAEAVLVADAHGKVTYLNATCARLLNLTLEDAVGRPTHEVMRLVNRQTGLPGDDVCERALSAAGNVPLTSDHALDHDNGEAPLPIVWSARVSYNRNGIAQGIVVVFRNPDEMNLTPQELLKANRLEALGLLAGGIAHDFNNLLTTILGGVSLAKDSRDFTSLEDSEQACLTAKGLTKQLLAAAKGGTGTNEVADTTKIIRDSIKIAAAGSVAVIEVEAPDEIWPVLVDRSQILQVFQNLIVNAVQAMPPEPHRGLIKVKLANLTLEEDQLPPLNAGDYIEISVQDNAAGISAENLQNIFNPFFTTKKHGTGLGLATVLSIVRKHGGEIGVESTEGTGTTFTVYLPRARKPADVQARRAPTLRFGTGRVLFMDDDRKICDLTSTMLESLDYKFDVAHNGEEAIKFYQRYLNIGRPYDAVIMDITVIGGMGGEECFRELHQLDPDVRAIVSSGYDNEDIATRFLDMGFCGYLTKPYRVTDLGKVLKAVLG